MVEHHLGEGLALSLTTEIGIETEGLHDREVGLDREHGRSGSLLLREDLATTTIEYAVDTTDGVLRALNLNFCNRLERSFMMSQLMSTYRGRRAPVDQGWRAGKQRRSNDGR